jgi:hypothetical protein
MPNTPLHHVVIIGGGFGGLYAAKALRGAPVRVTLVDRRNFHLFQPLLYQVATGGLSAGDISYPLRSIFQHEPQFSVIMAEVTDIDVAQRTILLRDGRLSYDTLIVAPGSTHQYFGHDDWAQDAPALKTIEDALEIRRRIFVAFEAAEREPDPESRRALMTFVIVGGGPTGVELAGTLGELAHGTLKYDFRAIDPAQAKILVLEGAERILAAFPPDLSAKAVEDLTRLGGDGTYQVAGDRCARQQRNGAQRRCDRDRSDAHGLMDSGGSILPAGRGVGQERRRRTRSYRACQGGPGPDHSRASRDFCDRRSGACCPAEWHTAARPGLGRPPGGALCR